MIDNTSHSSENFALLVEIKTKLERVISDVAKISNTLVTDVATLQTGKVDKVEAAKNLAEVAGIQADHETRIRANEQWRWKAIGIAIAVNIIIGGVFAIAVAYVSKG